MNRVLISAMIGLVGIPVVSRAAEQRPKLVVGIMVDQLRTDYLENLKDMFGAGGFRRLMDQGLYLQDLNYRVPGGDATSAATIIQTGTYPRYNGVTGMMIYDPETKTLTPVFNDATYIGNFTNETYSPAALRVTTLSDEIAAENKGGGKIHSIAPDASTAIALTGHAGTSAFWINDDTGRWSSTTYYSNSPSILTDKNYNSALISRLDNMKWEPLRIGEPYPDITSKETKEGFKYSLPRSDRNVFSLYKKTPFANADITDAAVDYIVDLGLGKESETIDVLNLAYSLGAYPGIEDGDYKYELEDAYLRLDKDLEKLFTTLDRQVGKDNVLVYLVSTGYFTEPERDNEKLKLPGGNFSVKRAMSLLNSFLSAKYGNESYIDQYHDGQIYLDGKVLEEKGLDRVKVAQESRDFLIRMTGVSEAYTLSNLLDPGISRLEDLKLSVDPKTSGDILLEFNPGWRVTDDTVYPTTIRPEKTTSYAMPGFILGPGVKAEVEPQPVEAVSIAPRIARILRIRSPNGCF